LSVQNRDNPVNKDWFGKLKQSVNNHNEIPRSVVPLPTASRRSAGQAGMTDFKCMPKLMISLDKKILDENSAVAKRMVDYGLQDSLYIIIPNDTEKFVELSPEVKVWGVEGNKIMQFKRLADKGRRIIKKNVIDLITAQDPFFTGLLGVILKTQTKIKLEIQLHGDFFSNDYYRRTGVKDYIQYWLARFVVLPVADEIRVVGQRIKDSLLKLGVKEEKIELRPIEIDKQTIVNYEPKTDLKKKYYDYKKIFLCLGRLEPVKNIFFLIDVFSEVVKDKVNGEARQGELRSKRESPGGEGALGQNKDFLLLIVGEGSQKNMLKEKVVSLALNKNIKFEDWVDDRFSYLKTCDAVLFPSLSEGYGLVPMEANAAGAPVIMNDVGVANYELIPDEKVKIISVNDKDAWIFGNRL